MKFAFFFFFFKCHENKVDVFLKCIVHRDNEQIFIVFILDSTSKINKIECEHDAEQPPLYSLTSRHCVRIDQFLTED